jgi:regulator of sirC expression with transglutaminase-like and TPR domain
VSDRARFAAVVASPDPSLGEGCALIARHLGHAGTVEGCARRLDDLAAEVLEALGTLSPVPVTEVAAHLFGSGGFRGNRARYDDPRNSLLPEVLERRTGIPITLSIVLIEVARRLGTHPVGVGMPGHFLVGESGRPTRWIDAFDGGAVLDEADARHRFAAIHGPAATFDPAFLRPTPGPQILARVLANLANVQRAAGDPTALVRILELRDEIPAVRTAPRARVELAEALVAVGRVADAVEVLEELEVRLEARRRGAVAARIAQLRASLN